MITLFCVHCSCSCIFSMATNTLHARRTSTIIRHNVPDNDDQVSVFETHSHRAAELIANSCLELHSTGNQQKKSVRPLSDGPGQRSSTLGARKSCIELSVALSAPRISTSRTSTKHVGTLGTTSATLQLVSASASLQTGFLILVRTHRSLQ